VEDLKVFFTASGLLAAVLAVWVRFWDERGLIGRAWCYSAVLTLLVGIGLAGGYNLTTKEGSTPDVAIGLFMAGVCMTVIAVGQSWLLVAWNCWRFMDGHEPVWRFLPGADLEKAKPDDIKKNEGLRRVIVLGPMTCGGCLILGFLLLSLCHFSPGTSYLAGAISSFTIASIAFLLTLDPILNVLKHTFFDSGR
jgi:hypothetical protein